MNVNLKSENRAAAFETVKPSELRQVEGGFVGSLTLAAASLIPRLVIMSR